MSSMRISISFEDRWDGGGFAGLGGKRSSVVWSAFGLHWFRNKCGRL